VIWVPNYPPLANDPLGPLTPEQVLVEYDGLRMFTSRDLSSRLLFAYQCDQEGKLWRYTVVPCSDRQLKLFEKGELTIVQMLTQPWGWVVNILDGSDVESIWGVDPTSLPDEYRPSPEVRLVSSAESDLSLRLLGSGIGHDHVPLSVVKQASERTMSVVRGLVDYIGTTIPSGLTDKESREYADLPVCGVLLASFQISLELPKAPDLDVLNSESKPNRSDLISREMRRLLGKVVEWSADPAMADGEPRPPEEAVAILRAIEELSPSGRTPVQEVQLGGKLVAENHRRTISLVRETRKRARSSIDSRLKALGPSAKQAIRWPEVIQATGVISEADTKRLTFYLRDIGPIYFLDRDPPTQEEDWPYGDLILFSFAEERWRSVVVASLDTAKKVTLYGKLARQSEQPEGVILAYTIPQYILINAEIHSGVIDASDPVIDSPPLPAII